MNIVLQDATEIEVKTNEKTYIGILSYYFRKDYAKGRKYCVDSGSIINIDVYLLISSVMHNGLVVCHIFWSGAKFSIGLDNFVNRVKKIFLCCNLKY